MNFITNTTEILGRYTRGGFAVLSLASLMIVTLFAFEAAPLRTATDEAYAWTCSITQESVSTAEGADVTLTWNAASDASYVTIDYFGDEHLALSGTRTVSITETTTFTAYTHIEGKENTLSCRVTVTVEPVVVVDPPVEEPPTEEPPIVVDPPVDLCEAIVVTIDDKSFTWTSPSKPLTGYNVEFCDGTIEKKSVSYNDTATFTFDKRIKSVKTCGCDCSREVTQTCTPEPKIPTCPFTADANTIVVNFDDEEKLMSQGGIDREATIKYPVSLPAGTYTIKTASWDGYPDRVNVSQPNEQWYLDLVSGDTTVVKTGFTTDLADNVIEAFIQETIETNFSVPSAVDGVYGRHAYYLDESSWNSVVPICAAFVRIPVEEHDIACTMSISPTKVNKGQSATLTWTSDNATKATIDQGIGDVALDGTQSVVVNGATTYTGTFSDDDGHSVTCKASVSTGGGGGKCLNCDDDEPKEKEPSVVLSAKTIKGASITLNQIPYTGFTATPTMTVLFWLAILAISAAIAYAITVVRHRMSMRTMSVNAHTVEEHNFVDYSVTMPTMSLPKAGRVEPIALQQAHSDHSETQTIIEDTAHRDNILLSPEATRMIAGYLRESGMQERDALEELFGRAKASYPREDGWILLSKERSAALLNATPTQQTAVAQEKTGATRTPTVAEAPARVAHMERVQVPDTATSTFVRYLATNDQAKAFELLRTVSAQGTDIGTFIGRVVRDLDEVFKNRIEGNRKPDQALVQLTQGWTTPMFETVLGALVECIDYSYSNTRIGAKVALAKAFEAFSAGK